jgi:hypothetical protein
MAQTYSFRVLENAARNYILQVNATDAVTTTAGTTNGTSTGIIAANGYTPTIHLKISRVLYNTTNCVAQLQWHATTNTVIASLSGFGDFSLYEMASRSTFINNDQGTGATGDIDLQSFAIGTVTGGAGLVTASLSLILFCIKGV